jgi:NAD(P)H-flavin reductase/16S rRNA G966 N2-methylase RsmD
MSIRDQEQKKQDHGIEYPLVSYPYSEKFSTSLYKMHKFWGRKPPNVVAKYIENYTHKNGIVLDPFVGSGTTAIEAIRLQRRVIGIDINPLAIFITRTALKPVRLASLEVAFRSVIEDIIPVISPWYETSCMNCGMTGQISYVVHEGTDHDLRDETPLQISYKCPCKGKRTQTKAPDRKDHQLIKAANEVETTDWYPEDLVLPHIRHGYREAKHIKDLFSNRNLFSLTKIYASISQHSSGIVRDCLLLAFSSSLAQCSRLCGVDRRGSRISAMGWILTSFRIMKYHVERNPIEAFTRAFQRVLKGKREANRVLTTYSEATTATEVFDAQATALIKTASVDDLDDLLEGNRVDYVFTDPPHGPSLQYMKLSALSNAWLKMPLSSEQEIIQKTRSESSAREYGSRLQAAFEKIRACVSNKATVHVYFRGNRDKDWLDAAGIFVRAGFQVRKSVFQPQRLSFRTTFRGRGDDTILRSPPGDWILHLKVGNKVSQPIDDINGIEEKILKAAENIIRLRGQPTRFRYILMYVATRIPPQVLANDPELIIKILKKHLGSRFANQTLRGGAKVSDEFWSILREKPQGISLNAKIKKAAIKVLIGREAVGSSKLYLYQAVYSRFPSEFTPDPTAVEKVIREVAFSREDGNRLYLRDEYAQTKELHSEIIWALLKFGLDSGFGVYVSPRAVERIQKSELAGTWKEILDLKKDQLLFPEDLPSDRPAIEFANILWMRNGSVHAHFEVEDRAEIDESTFIRGNEIRKYWPESERVLVVPHKNVKTITRLLKNRQSFWHLAPYHSILTSYDPNAYRPFEAPEDRLPASASPLKLKVVSKDDICDSKGELVAFKMKLLCPPDVLSRVRPGHFLMIEINSGVRRRFSKYFSGQSYNVLRGRPNSHPERLEFLRIPLSIHRVYYEAFEPGAFKNRSRDFLPTAFWEWIQHGEMRYLDLLVRLVGHGTRMLHTLKEGDTTNVIGPLGKPIDFPPDFENAILISGGVGLASLYPIAHHLRQRGYKAVLFAGSKDRRTLQDKSGRELGDFVEMGVECHATDEVTEGKLVTELVSEWLNSDHYDSLPGSSRIYSCGPWPMLKVVHDIAVRHDLPCTVLVDKLMLCGVGACSSCVVAMHDPIRRTSDKHPHIKMVRSCTDGPAFDSRNIIWDYNGSTIA